MSDYMNIGDDDGDNNERGDDDCDNSFNEILMMAIGMSKMILMMMTVMLKMMMMVMVKLKL